MPKFKSQKHLEIRGLPIFFKNAKLVWTNKITSLPVRARKISQARDFLKDKNAASQSNDIYLMYRGICFKKDKNLFKQHHLRYDITVIFPGLLGKEFSKTIGHYHQRGSKITYPEIYEILSGSGIFLFQKIEKDKSRVKEIYFIKVKRGQNIIIPPGFAHITINTTDRLLILANIFADNVNSVYSFLKKHHGAGYYVLKGRAGDKRRKNKKRIIFEKNPNYKMVSKLKVGTSKETPGFKIFFKKTLYNSFIQNPKNFEFLTKPEKYLNLLKPQKLFNIKS